MMRSLLFAAASALACAPAAPSSDVPEPDAIEPAQPAPLPAPPAPAPDRSGAFLDVVQDDKAQPVMGEASVALRRAPFSLRFPLRSYTDAEPHSVRVVASAEHPAGVSAGAGIGENDPVTPFSPGTGMAASEQGGYRGALVLDDMGHHYLFYVSATDSRVRVVDKLEDGRMLVAFDIEGIAAGEAVTPMKDAKLTKLYLTALMDADLDQRVDEGELFRVTISFDQ
jgi:hypothetical protein